MLRVALMDDHPLMLKVVSQELAQALDIKIVWKTTDSAELTERVKRDSPDVLVLISDSHSSISSRSTLCAICGRVFPTWRS